MWGRNRGRLRKNPCLYGMPGTRCWRILLLISFSLKSPSLDVLIVHSAKISQYCSVFLHLVKALSKSAGSGACISHHSATAFSLSTAFQGMVFLCNCGPQRTLRPAGACPSLTDAQMHHTSALLSLRQLRSRQKDMILEGVI